MWTGERESVRGGYHLPFTGVGHISSMAAAVRAAAHSAPVLVASPWRGGGGGLPPFQCIPGAVPSSVGAADSHHTSPIAHDQPPRHLRCPAVGGGERVCVGAGPCEPLLPPAFRARRSGRPEWSGRCSERGSGVSPNIQTSEQSPRCADPFEVGADMPLASGRETGSQ